MNTLILKTILNCFASNDIVFSCHFGDGLPVFNIPYEFSIPIWSIITSVYSPIPSFTDKQKTFSFQNNLSYKCELEKVFSEGE